MTRIIKIFGLALIAMLVLSAVGAGAAQAETLVESELAEPETTKLDATDVTGTEDGKLARLTIGTGANFIECTQAKVTSSGAFEGKGFTFGATPRHEQCFARALKTAPATVTHGGCAYAVTATKESGGKVLGDITLICPAGKQIEVHTFENEKAEKENKPLCTYDIKGQTITGAEITSAGAGATRDFTLNLSTLSKLKLTNTGPAGIASCGIASGAEGTGALSGKITVTGTNSGGTQVGIFFK